MKQVIFLTGHRKSGTTLIKSLLDGHPSLCIYPTDLTLLYAYFPHCKFKNYSKKVLIDSVVKIVLKSLKSVKNYTKYSSEELIKFKFYLKQNLKNKNLLSEKQVILTVLNSWKFFFKHNDNNILLVKETTQSMNIKVLKKIFSKLKFVQIIRDPRDNYGSLKSGLLKYYKKLGYNNENLLLSSIFRIKNDLKFARLLKKKKFFLIIKYEQLVKNPKREVGKVLNFLNISKKNFKIEPTNSNNKFLGNSFERIIKGISSSNVYSWKKRITKAEEDFINFYLEEEINFWKYPKPQKCNFQNVKNIYEKINSKILFKGKKLND